MPAGWELVFAIFGGAIFLIEKIVKKCNSGLNRRGLGLIFGLAGRAPHSLKRALHSRSRPMSRFRALDLFSITLSRFDFAVTDYYNGVTGFVSGVLSLRSMPLTVFRRTINATA